MSKENTDINQLEETKAKIKNYFKGVKSEWGKITWQKRPQIISETIIVLIIVFLLTTFVYVVDKVFQGLFHYLHLS